MKAVRFYWVPITHFIMIFFTFITNNPRLNMEGLKAFASFLGMLLQVNLLLQITSIMAFFPEPIPWTEDPNVSGVYLYLEVEWAVFLATLIGNATFIVVRTCVKHEI